MSDVGLSWFPLYPVDFVSSQHVAAMSTEDIGAYVLLLCYAWGDEDCGIPDDDARLERLTRTGSRWRKVRVAMREVWPPHPTAAGKLHNPRLYEEWIKAQALIEKRRAAGRASGEARGGRRNGHPTRGEQKPNAGLALAEHMFNGCPSSGGHLPTQLQGQLQPLIPPNGRDKGNTRERDPSLPVPESISSEVWIQACQLADLIEERGSSPCSEAKGTRRATAIAYRIEHDGEQRTEAVVRFLAEDPDGSDWKALRRFPDALLPRAAANGRHMPDRFEKAARALASTPQHRRLRQRATVG